MSVRFTSGNVGRLTFEHANRMADATDAVESMPTGDRIAIAPIRPDFVVAFLTERIGGKWFATGANRREYRVFNWAELGVSGQAPSRKLTQVDRGLFSNSFGNMPNGRAVQLGGAAEVGDIVTVFPLKEINGENWYGFVGREYANPSSMLTILGAAPNGKNRWLYTVQPVYWDGSARTDLPGGLAVNAHELSVMHGQRNSFANPDARIEIEGPVQGPVVGSLASRPASSTAYWAFDAPNPIIPECIEEAPQIEQLLKGGL